MKRINQYLRSRSSQMGLEFLILTVFLLILMVVVLGFTGYFLSSLNESDLNKEREAFAQTILSEFENAKTSDNQLKRSFNISPADLKKYNLTFYDGISFFGITDIRKDGINSNKIYYYEIGDNFRYNESFYVTQSGPGQALVISFQTNNSQEIDVLDSPKNLLLTQRSFYQNDTYIGGANEIKIVDEIAYVVSFQSDSLSLFNVSNPHNIVFISSITDPILDGAHDLRIQGNLVFIVSVTAGSLGIINVTDITSPSIVSSLSEPELNSAYHIEIDETYAYITSRNTIDSGSPPKFTIVNKSNVMALSIVSSINLDNSYRYWQMEKIGNFIFQTIENGTSGGVNSLNVSNVNNPGVIDTLLDSFSLRRAFGIEKGEDLIAYVSSFGRLTALNISYPSNLSIISSLDLGGDEHEGISVKSGYTAVTGFSDSKVKIVDTNDLSIMKLIMEYKSSNSLRSVSGIQFSENCLYAVSQTNDTISSFSFSTLDC